MEHLNILIADDTKEKIDALVSLLKDVCNIDANDIDIATNANQCRSFLRSKLYHLLIIDMLLPQFEDSQTKEEDAGARLIEDVFKSASYIKPIHIIGLTQHKEIFSDLNQRLEDKLWHLILYKQNSTDWSERIKEKVFQILATKTDIENSIINKNKFDIGVICALHDELSSMMESFPNASWKRKHLDGIPVDLYTTEITTAYAHKLKLCALSPCRAGVVPTATLAMSVYNLLKVDVIFMTGYAAGIKRDGMNLGDVVVAKSVQDYAVGKIVDSSDASKTYELLKEINQIQANIDIVEKATSVSEEDELLDDICKFLRDKTSERINVRVWVAPTVCGPFVVDSEDAMNEIKKGDRKLSALDMEGFGLYYAAHLLNKKALWLKGICDFGDGKKDDSYHKKSALASGRVLYCLIKEFM